VVEALRTRHYSRRTEEAYLHWIRRFLASHNGTHPREMAEMDVNRFLTHLAVGANVAASMQHQVLAAVLFLCEQVLERPLDRVERVVRARKPKRLPVVLTRDQVDAILAQLDGAPRLVCMLLYGSGMRLLEGPGLRVKDLDLGRGEITVRQGKGRKDRVTMPPGALFQPLQDHLGRVREQHAADLKSGLGLAPLPDALARKYPNANREWGWQGVFPASSHYVDRIAGIRHRHHLHESVIQSGPSGGSAKARDHPHLSASVCDPSTGGRLRHSNRPGTSGSQGRPDHDGLHARIESWRARGPESP
jgi:integron integrase